MEIPAPPPSAQPADPVQASQAAQPAVASSGPNASPLDLFPQVRSPSLSPSMWSAVTSFTYFQRLPFVPCRPFQMLQQMLLVKEIWMFCVTMHNSEAYFL